MWCWYLQVTVQVLDANDNSPVCPRPPEIQLDRSVDVGTVVTTLVVTDADILENAQIVFQRIEGDFASLFLDVNAETGEITTTEWDLYLYQLVINELINWSLVL